MSTPFVLADIFDEAMSDAAKYNLEAEVLVSMLHHLQINETKLHAAIAYAFSEWDI